MILALEPRRLRLDRLLVERGLVPTRAKAQALILAGRVFSGGRRFDKPGQLVLADTPLDVEASRRYVGRGGAKLAAALTTLRIEVAGRDALDVGASTGGFTQALLEAGARRVAALDVGRGQLDWSLRNDPRVTVLEGINARFLSRDQLPFVPSVAVVDVSFISLEQVLAPVVACLEPDGDLVALVKPQFEVGRGRVGRGGIVRDPALHREVLLRLSRFAAAKGWGIAGLTPSALRGAEGNQEFFLWLRPSFRGLDVPAVEQLVCSAVADTREGGK